MGNVDLVRVTNAEKAVLGCALVGDIGRAVLLQLGDQDFYDPKCQLIASVMRDMIRRNVPPDVITVPAEIAARGKSHLVRIGELHDLVNTAPPTMAAPHYAQQVRDNARVRLTNEAGQRLVAMTTSDDSADDLGEALARHADEMAGIPAPFDVEADHARTVHDLLNEDEEEEEWMIPGLIERGERIVITGPEGLGKSTVIKQLACCVAAGVDPWTQERVSRDGFRVLHIDTENSRRQTRRNYRWIGAGMPKNTAPDWRQRISLHINTAGVNLAGRDRAWFHQVAAACSPDLIVLGPAYKLMTGLDPNKDSDVLSLLAAIDEVRTRHDSAVLIEAHSPHGSEMTKRPVRPFGSSVWLRWPEVGFGFRVDEDQEKSIREMEKTQGIRRFGNKSARPEHLQIVSWRGQREDRDWPGGIAWGPDGGLPWVKYRNTERGAA
jgi:replicative DNA helicase